MYTVFGGYPFFLQYDATSGIRCMTNFFSLCAITDFHWKMSSSFECIVSSVFLK
jgi:hypothetical protein